MQGDFLITTKDYGRAHNPYGSALTVSEHSDGYFELVIPLEGIPSIFGDYETFDYNILTEIAKGLTKGKLEMQPATQEFLLTKENIHRLDELKNRILPYMVVLGNGIGYRFNAEIDYKVSDVDNGDNLKGELTITPSTFEGIVYDCRPFIRQTLTFANTIPSTVVLTKKQNSITYDCKIVESENAKVECDGVTKYTASWENGKLTISHTGEGTPDYELLKLTASSTEKMPNDSEHDKFAPYTLFVDLSYENI